MNSIKKELKVFNKRYLENLKSGVFTIDTAIKYIGKQKGKQIRPSLCLLIAKSENNINDKTFDVASLIEMIHVATLIHDDIVDDSELRRGWPSMGRVWKNKISLLVGDYIFSKALSTITSLQDIKLIEILSKTANELSRGEILQIQKSRDKTMSESVYYEMIKDKTASLFSACCELSSLTSIKNKELSACFKEFGMNFGMAYQIKDDLNDLLGSSDSLGKPTKLDLKKNMLTLPYIHCLDQMGEAEKRRFLISLKKLSKKNKEKEIQAVIEQLNGVNYAKSKMDMYIEDGLNSIKKIPNTQDLVTFTNNIFNEKA